MVARFGFLIVASNTNGTVVAPVQDFTLQWHDGSAWKDIPEAKVSDNKNPTWSTLFKTIETTRLRLTITAAPDATSRIWEVELYAPVTISKE